MSENVRQALDIGNKVKKHTHTQRNWIEHGTQTSLSQSHYYHHPTPAFLPIPFYNQRCHIIDIDLKIYSCSNLQVTSGSALLCYVCVSCYVVVSSLVRWYCRATLTECCAMWLLFILKMSLLFPAFSWKCICVAIITISRRTKTHTFTVEIWYEIRFSHRNFLILFVSSYSPCRRRRHHPITGFHIDFCIRMHC